MDIKVIDDKGRIRLTGALPGEQYEVKHMGGGVYRLERLRNGQKLKATPVRGAVISGAVGQ
jgi:hypothetical protein